MTHILTRLNPLASCIILLALITFSNTSGANDKVGRVIFSNGEITAVNNGKTQHLKRGSSISEGDILKTSSGAIAQLRMKDGALVALKSNTEFSIDKYQYSENSESNSSIFNLIKGGFRTVTGFIGKRNKQNYRVKTTVATIGIRGTHYGLTLCSQGDCDPGDGEATEDGLYGSVIDGEIYTDNKSGIHTFSNDEYFHIASHDSKPRNLLKPPGVIFQQQKLKKLKQMKDNDVASMLHKRQRQQSDLFLANIELRKEFLRNQLLPRYVATSDTNTSINSFLEPTNVGNVFAFSLTELDLGGLPSGLVGKIVNDGTADNQFFINAIARENGLIIPVAAQQTKLGNVRSLSIADALPLKPTTIKIPSTNVVVGWGRWSNQYVTTLNNKIVPHAGNLHYFVASETTSLSQLGGLTGSANYTTIGGTQATDLAGNIAPDVANVNLSVDFGSSGGITLYNVATSVGGITYQGRSTANPTVPLPFNTALTSGLNLLGDTGGPCPSCTGQASIAFMGAGAQGAGTVYTIKDNATNNSVNGAAILSQSSIILNR